MLKTPLHTAKDILVKTKKRLAHVILSSSKKDICKHLDIQNAGVQ